MVDFIAEQMKHSPDINDDEEGQSQPVSNLTSVKYSSQQSKETRNMSDLSLVNDMKDDQGGVRKNYFNSLCKEQTSKSKSIIPDIDFTNKYVKKAPVYNSRNNTSGISPPATTQHLS